MPINQPSRKLLLLLSLGIILVGARGVASAATGEHGAKQIAIRLQGTANPSQLLNDTLSEFGSQITRVVKHPDGGSLVSVDMPGNSGQRTAMESALKSVTGVSTVEKNACYEYYPDSINPSDMRSLSSPPAPSVEDFCDGGHVEWDPAETTQGPGNTFSSTTREQQSEQRKTVGWTQTRTRTGGGPSVPPEEPGGTAPPYPFEYDGGMACSQPGYIGHEAPNIKVKLAYSAFSYPRPIPLQAIAQDFDEMRWGCEGCSGEPSSKRLFVEDKIVAYKYGYQQPMRVCFKSLQCL